ncbi:NaeI family type II restriction endonuclease [Paenibacillus alkalitolerans]|uniref:NaeI family type II restriction endonuclease n=1 Tax=Paenibacillus alkalitolerans TaxID=2799335 RepID=UPI0018F2E214|nr:NaeI family type II restriction endonuclease [Paenibacillus alkalitolerans]
MTVYESMPEDVELLRVKQHLLSISGFESKVAAAIRHAIDEVISGRYTGRFSIDQIDKTEKTYIGTKVQHMIQHHLNLPYGKKLDTVIAGIDVDIKFTIGKNWTIPLEAVDELCLLVSAQDEKSTFQVGLIRTTSNVLNMGKNRDGKRTINQSGRKKINWLIEEGALPRNVLLSIPSEKIEKIFANKSGQDRINELFRLCPEIVFNSAAIESVASQKDSSKRVRDARRALEKEGIMIYSGYDNEQITLHGLNPIKKEEFISIYSLTKMT